LFCLTAVTSFLFGLTGAMRLCYRPSFLTKFDKLVVEQDIL
jgi:hypothetical protein